MRTIPLCSCDRSFDGQRWEPLNYAETRFLFHEIATFYATHQSWSPELQRRAVRSVAAVIDAVEQGEVAKVQLSESVELHLRRTHCWPPSQHKDPVVVPSIVPLTRA